MGSRVAPAAAPLGSNPDLALRACPKLKGLQAETLLFDDFEQMPQTWALGLRDGKQDEALTAKRFADDLFGALQAIPAVWDAWLVPGGPDKSSNWGLKP